MKPQASFLSSIRRQRPRGFALIITLVLTMLITLVSLAVLSLSTITIRSSDRDRGAQEARSNARVALMLAIGELQTKLGPDQRISARSSTVNGVKGEPNALGAWESWRWQPGTGSPNYSEKAAKFRGWLVSTPDPDDLLNPQFAGSSFTDPITLIDPDTVGKPQDTPDENAGLRASKISLTTANRAGKLAWAVMDESLKAPIHLEEKTPTDIPDKLAQRVAPSRARAEAVLEELAPSKLGDPAKLVSLQSAVVATGGKKTVLSQQADVTPYSMGLLTNVADGGLKMDLSTLFESTDSLSDALGNVTAYGTTADGGPRWDYLRSHYQLYRKVTNAAAGAPMVSQSISTSSDLKPGTTGVLASPDKERLMPVISKLQIMFSVVTHYSHITDRVNFYNNSGDPKGNTRYGVPHLVYDPVVTLYNPYDVALELPKLRVQISDPPVLFGFKKNNVWLRNEFASGKLLNLARLTQIGQNDTNARKSLTLVLRDANAATGAPASKLRLEPGEVKVFSPWVEKDWDWAMETAGQYAVRAFFDFDAKKEFANKDGRTGNKFGVEAVPGWNPRAGLQVDHLSNDSARPTASHYAFETGQYGTAGWVAIRSENQYGETFTVNAKAGRANENTAATAEPDFKVSILGAVNETATSDLLRSYEFRFNDIEKELVKDSTKPLIERTFLVEDLLQSPSDKTPAGKTPFAVMTMSAKTTIDQRDDARPWLHNHPVTEGASQNSRTIGNALQSYDVRFDEVQDFNTFPGVEIDSSGNRGFYGASATAARGVSNVPMFRVPLMPAASLGDLIPANLIAGSVAPRVTHALGNSRAHPMLPSSAVIRASPAGVGNVMDHSYFLNDAMWDRYFFSTAANSTAGLLPAQNRKNLLTAFFKGDKKLLNPRFTPLLTGGGSAEDQAKTLDGLSDTELAKRMASGLGVRGAFNVNSDSVAAWKALLSSMRDTPLTVWGNGDKSPKGRTAYPRFGLPLTGAAEESASVSSIDVQGQLRWAGFRSLDDTQISDLAKAIVKRMRERGGNDKAPFLTLGEFVNRRLGGEGDASSLEGLLQQAITDSKINDVYRSEDSKMLSGDSSTIPGLAYPNAHNGSSGEGAPSMLTQGDLMMALAPVVTVRGDTFRIRAYGESLDSKGNLISAAWCEAIVQRMPDYVDPSDAAETLPASLNPVNKIFGRRFEMTMFRWLSKSEI